MSTPEAPGPATKKAPPTTGRTLLRDGDFRLLWTGETASKLGTSVSSLAMPLVAVQVLDASALAVSLLTAALWLPWLIVGLPAGAWVDRSPKRAVMISCDLLATTALLSVPLAAWLDVLDESWLIGVNLVVGTCTVFFGAAWNGWLPTVLTREEVAPANAFLQGSESAAQVAGPGVAGLLAGLVGAIAGLVVDALTFLVSAAALARFRRQPRAIEAPPRRRLRSEIADGLGFVMRDPVLRRLVLHGGTSNLALVGYQAVLVVFLVRDVGLSAGAVGLLLALTSLGGVLGATLSQALVRRVGTARALILCKAGAAPFALLVPLTERGPQLALFVAGTVVVVAGVVGGNVISTSWRQTYCPPHLLGRVMTSMQVVNIGTVPFGAVLAGLLATAIGNREAIAVLTAVFAAAGLVLVFGPLRGLRDLPESPSGR